MQIQLDGHMTSQMELQLSYVVEIVSLIWQGKDNYGYSSDQIAVRLPVYFSLAVRLTDPENQSTAENSM